MSIHSIDGKTPSGDVRQDRIAAGTVGGEHATPGSFSGSTATGTISIFDPRVSYIGSGWFLSVGQLATDYMGEYAQCRGSATESRSVSLNFSGTSVAIIGSLTYVGGYADVYVDGVLQAGKTQNTTYLSASYSKAGLNATDTTINVNDTSQFTASGTVLIDSEIITYTGVTASSFTGCTRSGSQTHITGGMVYQYTSRIDTYSANRQSRVALWSNSLLAPGIHTLTLVVRADANASVVSPPGYIELGAFIVGGLIGAANINTGVSNLTFTGVSFNASGIAAAAGFLGAPTTNQQILGVISVGAYSGSTFKPCFGSFNSVDGTYSFYCPTGASSTLTVVVTLLVLGATI